LLGRYKAAIDVYNEASKLCQNDWVNIKQKAKELQDFIKIHK
jgi:hypothetical protein